MSDEPIRVVLAKLGLDGHDRGIKVVARMLRDAGFEVIYLGLRQTAASIVGAVEQEDADAIGISMLNGGHMALSKKMLAALAEADLDVPLIIGGIVPDDDADELRAAGVAGVLTPGSSADEVAAAVRRAVEGAGSER
ncbi:MAG: cobalamin-dependent protein [Acidimicrobiia bacterium]|nr:cobalamin-dependent protein [Acidimicrobiia bacterium]